MTNRIKKTLLASALIIGSIFATTSSYAADNSNTLTIDGYILSFVVANITKSLDENTGKEVTIKVDSTGGPELSSLNLAKAIAKHGKVTLLINGQCTNSCANFLIPAANRVIVTKGSIISFNTTSLQEYSVMGSSGYKPSEDLTYKANKVNDFYKEHPINDKMTFCSWLSSDPYLKLNSDNKPEIAYNGKILIYSAKNLKELGIKNASEIVSKDFATAHPFLVSPKFLESYKNYDDYKCSK